MSRPAGADTGRYVRKGYAAAGIADLAGELGIGHGTVYLYFGNKRDVAAAVLDRALERIATVVTAEDATCRARKPGSATLPASIR